MNGGFLHRGIRALFATTLVWLVLPQPASAATHEQIVAHCREAARPRVVACVISRGGNRQSPAIIAACRQSVGRPLVVSCVRREEQRQAASKPAPPIPKDETATPAVNALVLRPVFVPPPRTVADITAILDSEKPDEMKIAERKAKADALPRSNAPAAELAQFYYDRGAIRAILARDKDALADGAKALALKAGPIVRIREMMAMRYRALGDPKKALDLYEDELRDANQPGKRGAMINALADIAETLYSMGDIDRAAEYARRVETIVQEARGSPNPLWRKAYGIYGHYWESEADAARALVLESHGQYGAAEAARRRAEAFRRASLNDLGNYASPPPREAILHGADVELLFLARDEALQGRLSEAEADTRRALLEILKEFGKYDPATPLFIRGLAAVLVQQGRYVEAEKLSRTAVDVQHTLGIADDAPSMARNLSQLGRILVLQGKMEQANAVYAQLDSVMAQWRPEQRETFKLNNSRIVALYAAGQIEAGLAAAEELVKRETVRTGQNSFETASARGILAIGYARAGRDADAIREFKAAIPEMTMAEETAESDDSGVLGARRAHLQRIVEAYITLLARSPDSVSGIANETFALADAVRGRAVEQALTDSTARAAAKDPALAALVRKNQDLGKQIGAALGMVNNMLALPSDQRDQQKILATNAEIVKLRADRKTAQEEIKRRFPSYANLVDPKPPSIGEIKATLRPGEALLSFYFGQTVSFVWAVPKSGPVAFAVIPLTAPELAAEVYQLRKALEPNGPLVEEIPPFDVARAYRLYATLLKPVEAGWRDAKSLIVVTNGALGELPLGLLPTAPATVDLAAKPLFAGYRSVPWLARSHAVTELPSASALIMLRHLPPGAPGRDKLIGFGDPYFSEQEAAEADRDDALARVASGSANSIVTRGIPLKLRAAPHTEDADRAELSSLPRLADTRAELIAIAHALGADPGKALYMGRAANEQNVKTLDLSHYRIVAFATHGLVPGDIDGLTQPALALTAPDVAGVQGDGLLTMGEILALKLDADWVVLSACNTAAGSGAGAEAASGLGSAFFYAGTRALLVTNWSVHSASARALIGDLFRRQSVDPNLSRAEALRQAMMALLDGSGYVDQSGNTLFTYAHPLFWAPYSVIGDGGTY